MLQILNATDVTWATRLGHCLTAHPDTAVLLKFCGCLFGTSSENTNSLTQLVRHYAADHPVTLLSTQMDPVVVNGSVQLLSESPPPFEHLYLSPRSLQLSEHTPASLGSLQQLIDIVAQLRSSTGCPWDRAQTPESLTPYIVEEAYETVAAIQSGDAGSIADELGDLLLQVVLQSQIFSESQTFNIGDVADTIAAKLIRRHPHVFGPQAGQSSSMEAIHQSWDQIKQAEKPTVTLAEKLVQEARILPPLTAALKISKKIAKVGFEWPSIEELWSKVAEEESELKAVLNASADARADVVQDDLKFKQAAELGDLLFTIVNVGRWYGLDAADALHRMNQRFTQRILYMEALAQETSQNPGVTLQDFSLEALEALWQQAKRQHPY